ncbi:hypothetical protein HDU99_002349 [Rhizoclosmatium hyalinum]|nr:hypothetical protein HDU99_002349 [Rhizoclosmatium hyalinum]
MDHGFSSFYQAFPVFTEQEAAKLGLKTQSGNKSYILVAAFTALAVFIGYAYREVQKESKKENGGDDE